MKKLTLAMAACAMIAFTSCKKETETTSETELNSDGTITTETNTDTDYVMDADRAEARYNEAQRDLEAARANGDTEAERIAQKAADDAKAAWEKTKAATKEAGQDIKEGYNEALEDAKAD